MTPPVFKWRHLTICDQDGRLNLQNLMDNIDNMSE